MPRSVDRRRRELFVKARFEDELSRVASCRMAGVSDTWAKKFEKDFPDAGANWRAAREEASLGGPKSRDELAKEPLKALDDFGYFRQRYFGRISVPWQEEAAYRTLELLESPDEEYVVENCPPGAGKSSLYTHDIPAWLTCRDRSIRGLLGSRAFRLARTATALLKATFERPMPFVPSATELHRGLAVEPTGVLARDYGRFKPLNLEVWTKEQFVVAQQGDAFITQKEPTWAAFGMDSESIGWRVNYVVWDDLVTVAITRSMEQTVQQQEWWRRVAENRLEPGGLLALVGQRLAPNDLYRHCLDKTVVGEYGEEGEHRVYHHIVFKAHYEERCQGEESHHRDKATAYPDGCLLDPKRLSWSKLLVKQTESDWATVYQQEDADPESILVQSIWVSGGRGADGVDYLGCWDDQRACGQLPAGLAPPLLSVVSADPSPTKNWGVLWWVFQPATELRYLVDIYAGPLDAPGFLDWDQTAQCFTGLMQDWQVRSQQLGLPITHWIVETNAAQRFLLQYSHVRRWRTLHGTNVVPHHTGANKADPKHGVWSLSPEWQHGRVRLPGKRNDAAGMRGLSSRTASLFLVREATVWPTSQATDDCVMAQWMFEWNLPRLRGLTADPATPAHRPSWLPGVRRSA